MIFDDEQVATQLSEAWEHDRCKDELNVVLQGLEQHFSGVEGRRARQSIAIDQNGTRIVT